MASAGFYKAIKSPIRYEPSELPSLLAEVSQSRVQSLASALSSYLSQSLPITIRSKKSLQDYRTNPYVLMTTSSTMRLEDPRDLANFLVNLKLYMSLETSFGKSLESIVMGHYPVGASPQSIWNDPPEKIAEFAALEGLGQEEKAQRRATSAWREIDRVCVAGNRRHLLSIKSGPATINDTQVAAMYAAIRDHHRDWLDSSVSAHGVEGIDVVIGLTYGTPKSTNNKENQILAKLIGDGFEELDRTTAPGVLSNEEGTVHIQRQIGVDFWSYVGGPHDPANYPYVFLEVLLALSKALREGASQDDIESALNERLDLLAEAVRALKFPRNSLPDWVREDFTVPELAWLAAAMTAYFDAAPGVELSAE